MVIIQGQITYVFRGKEMAFDFYPVQPLERIGVAINGVRTPVADGYRFTLTVIPAEEITLKSVSVDMATDLGPHSRVFVNGFQSWTESREYDLKETMPRLRWPASTLARYGGDYGFCRYSGQPGVFHGWTYSYTRSADGNTVLYGSISEKPGYTLFEFDTTENLVRVSRDCHGLKLRDFYTALDILVLPGREADVFDMYFREIRSTVGRIGRGNAAPAPSASGWTSRHSHSTHVSEPVVMANLAELRKRGLPVDYFLIDDGWQRTVGDWLTPGPEFPKGMKAVADAIRESGYRPGLWIAPFISSRWSDIWRHHKGWILRDQRGKPIKAGWNSRWGGPFYGIDAQNPDFREYLKQVFDTVLGDWGFEMVNADYLYAAGLGPNERQTRGGAMCEAIELLQESTRGKVCLAGGVPLGPAFSRVDYCRVGADATLCWEDGVRRMLGHRERASASSAIASAIGRRHLHGRAFSSDTGAFVLRTRDQKMTSLQKLTLFRLQVLLGGLSFVSDNPAEYSQEELAAYCSAFPIRDKKVLDAESRRGAWTVKFEVDGRLYLLLANLTAKTREFRIDPGVYFDPGSPGLHQMESVSELKPFDSKCLLRAAEQDWEILGSTGHMFPGCEIEGSLDQDGGVTVSVHRDARYETEVFLRVPGNLESCRVNTSIVRVHRIHEIAFVRVRLEPVKSGIVAAPLQRR